MFFFNALYLNLKFDNIDFFPISEREEFMTISIHRPFQRASSYEFYKVDKNSSKMGELTRIFQTVLQPLYGDQTKALRQIAEAKDRDCYLLCDGPESVGVLVFKKMLSNEFEEFGIKDSIEIKSLFVVNSSKNSGKGIGSTLLHKVKEEVCRLHLGHESLHVTVSEAKKESRTFFLKKGFQIKHVWINRYQKDEAEFLLSLPVKVDQVGRSQLRLSKREGEEEKKSLTEEITAFVSQKLWGRSNAHWGSIHILLPLSDGTFISGSKDNSLYKWNPNGTLMAIVQEAEPREVDAKDWITAAAVINDKYWISGERTGKVVLWSTQGECIGPLKMKLPFASHHYSAKENAQRVNCLVGGGNQNQPSFFAGFPTLLNEYNLIERRTVSSIKAHENDWVYCVHPLTEDRMLVVIAATLQVWKRDSEGKWGPEKTLIQEPPRKSIRIPRTRPHITSLACLDANSTQFGVGDFAGSVKIVDIEKGKIVKHWKEHRGKVWKVAPLRSNLFASGSEDRTIRLWDAREENSVQKLGPFPGEVTALLNLGGNQLIAGAGIESRPLRSYSWSRILRNSRNMSVNLWSHLNRGAQLSCYEIRK